MIIQCCTSDTDLFERYMKSFPCVELLTRGIYISTSSLIPFLDDTKIHNLFSKNSMMLRLTLPHLPIAEVLLKGIQAVVWALEKPIPPSAKPYFEGFGPDVIVEDLPVSFALPYAAEIVVKLEDDTTQQEFELGALIVRWSSLSK
jgi:hypothetical protein